MDMNKATTKQIDFLNKLYARALNKTRAAASAGNDEAKLVVALIDAGFTLDASKLSKREASKIIDVLLHFEHNSAPLVSALILPSRVNAFMRATHFDRVFDLMERWASEGKAMNTIDELIDALLAELLPPSSNEQDEENTAAVAEESDADVITAAEAATRYGVKPVTIRAAIQRGRLPARKSGGTWLIKTSDLEAYFRREEERTGGLVPLTRAAALLGVTPDALRRRARNGHHAFSKEGSKWFMRTDSIFFELRALLKKHSDKIADDLSLEMPAVARMINRPRITDYSVLSSAFIDFQSSRNFRFYFREIEIGLGKAFGPLAEQWAKRYGAELKRFDGSDVWIAIIADRERFRQALADADAIHALYFKKNKSAREEKLRARGYNL